MIKPSQIIGEDYLFRWYLIPRNRFFNVYLHKFGRSDDDRALHDHPWHSVSILLKGSYVEHFDGESKIRRAFSIFGRKATTAHRIEVVDGPVWTVFITGRNHRQWGFWCPQGWRHWTEFTDQTGSNVGRGCD